MGWTQCLTIRSRPSWKLWTAGASKNLVHRALLAPDAEHADFDQMPTYSDQFRSSPSIPDFTASRCLVRRCASATLGYSAAVAVTSPMSSVVSALATEVDLTGVAGLIRGDGRLDPLLIILPTAFELQPRASTVSGLARSAGITPALAAGGRSQRALPDFLHAVQPADVAAARQTRPGIGVAPAKPGIDRRTASATVGRVSSDQLPRSPAGETASHEARDRGPERSLAVHRLKRTAL